jgi:hypothetical protein
MVPKLNSKRKQRINRLIQIHRLLAYRAVINRVWGWKERRRIINSLAHQCNAKQHGVALCSGFH